MPRVGTGVILPAPFFLFLRSRNQHQCHRRRSTRPTISRFERRCRGAKRLAVVAAQGSTRWVDEVIYRELRTLDC